MELLLIRHGRPRPERSDGAVDPPLTDRGRAESALLGAFLTSGPGPTPDVVYASPMRRARETAAEIAADVRIEERLREFDSGATSYTPPELITTGPAGRAALWRALETGVWGDHRFDPDAFERHVGEAFDAIVAAHPSAVVAVVCHSGVINSFLGTVLERPRGMFFQPEYTSISRVAASRDGRRQLLSLNETSHLITASERSPR